MAAAYFDPSATYTKNTITLASNAGYPNSIATKLMDDAVYANTHSTPSPVNAKCYVEFQMSGGRESPISGTIGVCDANTLSLTARAGNYPTSYGWRADGTFWNSGT